MKTTLLRAGALSCALLASTALVTPAQAQSLPRFNQVDENGVDLYNGQFYFSMLEGSIGSGEGELTLVRNWAGSGWTDNWTGGISVSSTQAIVEFGTYADSFTLSGGVFTSTKADGATLAAITNGYRYIARDGTQIDYRTGPDPASGAEQLVTQGCASGSTCGIPVSIRRPSGMTYTMQYDLALVCAEVQDGACNHVAEDVRWHGVTNSANYAFTVTYESDDPGDDLAPTATAAWHRRTGAQFTNLDGAPASLPTATYNQVSSTVLDVTTTGGETWRLTTSGGKLSGIRRPGAGSDTTSISYSGSIVSGVTSEGVSASYSRFTSGTGGSMTVTTADGDTVYDLNLTKERVINRFDPASRLTAYSYDTSGRLTAVTAPEGNQVQYTYDGRGNVTQVLARAKLGSGLSDIVTTASYDATCSNVVTCNQPNSITDARGFRTDYTYDSTHGGVTSVTQPAASGSTPVGSGDRPETRYSYTQVTAVTGQPVYMLTGVSACTSGTVASSCVGTTSESRQVFAYDTDNLRTTSVSARNGDNSLSATSAFTYDQIGNTLTVDGPLSGSADTTRYRHDAARRVVGVIGPDPDGGGSLHHRALRTTYTNGLPTKVEQGNVNSQSDGDWASFAASQRVEVDYDSNARPIQQRLMSGSTTYQVGQASYDSMGRVRCTVQRMNPAEFASLTSDACALDTQGTGANDFGPDRIARFSYNGVGQVTKVETGYGVSGVSADEATTTYTNNGLPQTVTDAEGNKTTYEYDGHDRLLNTRYPSPTTDGLSAPTSGTGNDFEQLGYDAAGNVTSRRLRDGSSIAYSYDNLNRPMTKDLPGSEPTVSYAYDLLGQMTSASFSGHTLTFGFDALGRRTSESGPHGTLNYAYDLSLNRMTMTYPDSGLIVRYDHNAAGDLTGIVENPSGSNLTLATYSYNDRGLRIGISRGNGTSTSSGYDNVSRLTQLVQDLHNSGNDLQLDFTLNPAGEIASTTRSNDSYAYTGHANANVTGTANGLNQLTAVGGVSNTHDNRGNVSAIGSDSYGYSSENLLISAPSSTTLAYDPLNRLYQTGGGSTTRFAYDGGQIIGEYDGSNALQRRYVFGPGTDEPLVQYEGSGTSARRWFHADERGSVVAVSDASGDVVTAVNRYDEYGNVQGTLTGRFGFTGQAWLPEIGMAYYRARIYDPAMGRFMQTDPIGFGGGMNLYAYVGNNPVNFVDPLGLQCNGCNIDVPGIRFIPFINTPSPLDAGLRNVNERGGLSDDGGQDVLVEGVRLVRVFETHDYALSGLICDARTADCSHARSRINSEICNIPGRYSTSPVENGGVYWVFDRPTPFLAGIPGGRVITTVSNNGLRFTNTTTALHIFAGTITRDFYQDANGSWRVNTHGFGDSIVPGLDWLNQETGPGIFRAVDLWCRVYVQGGF